MDAVNQNSDFIVVTVMGNESFIFSKVNIPICILPDPAFADPNPNVRLPLLPSIIFIVMILLIIPLASANLCLHSAVKDLQTVPGLLIVMMSVIMIVIVVVYLAIILHGVIFSIVSDDYNEGPVCKTFFLMFFYVVYAYEVAKLAYVFHFTFLMYRSYKLRSEETKKQTMCNDKVCHICNMHLQPVLHNSHIIGFAYKQINWFIL